MPDRSSNGTGRIGSFHPAWLLKHDRARCRRRKVLSSGWPSQDHGSSWWHRPHRGWLRGLVNRTETSTHPPRGADHRQSCLGQGKGDHHGAGPCAPGTELQGAQGGHSPHNCSRARALKENTRSSGLEEPGKGAQCRGQLEAQAAESPLGAARG